MDGGVEGVAGQLGVAVEESQAQIGVCEDGLELVEVGDEPLLGESGIGGEQQGWAGVCDGVECLVDGVEPALDGGEQELAAGVERDSVRRF